MIDPTTISGEEGFMVNCDKCSYFQFFATGTDFMAMRKLAYQDGWRFEPKDGGWTHICEECRGKE